MDWDLLLEEYYTWVPTVANVFNVNTGSTQDGEIVPSIEDAVDIINDLFGGPSTAVHIIKVANTVSLNGFVMWLKYVKNI